MFPTFVGLVETYLWSKFQVPRWSHSPTIRATLNCSTFFATSSQCFSFCGQPLHPIANLCSAKLGGSVRRIQHVVKRSNRLSQPRLMIGSLQNKTAFFIFSIWGLGLKGGPQSKKSPRRLSFSPRDLSNGISHLKIGQL